MRALLVPFTCTDCGGLFPPEDGGICTGCGRPFCGWCLLGPEPALVRERRCRECRRP